MNIKWKNDLEKVCSFHHLRHVLLHQPRIRSIIEISQRMIRNVGKNVNSTQRNLTQDVASCQAEIQRLRQRLTEKESSSTSGGEGSGMKEVSDTFIEEEVDSLSRVGVITRIFITSFIIRIFMIYIYI